MTETLAVDELSFEVRRSARRKTLELIVDRGGELVIAAPADLDAAVMREFVRSKRFWIFTKIAEKKARREQRHERRFINGESFPYLGRNHELVLVDEQDPALKLVRGRFCLLRSEAGAGRRHFIRWYGDHARPWLERSVATWQGRLRVRPTELRVLDLGFRWGSCGVRGALNFHWATIMLPARIVEYVVVHELAHLRTSNHGPAFWKRVALALPDYEQRKAWLAEHGARQVAL